MGEELVFDGTNEGDDEVLKGDMGRPWLLDGCV